MYGIHCCLNSVARICQHLLICSSLDEHLGSFQCGAVMNKTDMNIIICLLRACVWVSTDLSVGLELLGEVFFSLEGEVVSSNVTEPSGWARSARPIKSHPKLSPSQSRRVRLTRVWVGHSCLAHLVVEKSSWTRSEEGCPLDANEGIPFPLGDAGDGRRDSGLALFGELCVVYPWLSKHRW